MQTKKALKAYTKHEYKDNGFQGPLKDLTDHYQTLISQRKQAEAQKASEPELNTPYLALLTRKAKELKASSVLNSDLPAIALFDAVLHAIKADQSDHAIRAYKTHIEKLLKEDPLGSLSIKQIVDLKTHYTRNYPKSKIASLIDTTCTKSGYNTLPIRKLSDIASKIESQADYNQICNEYGLNSNKSEHIRSRAFIRELVNLKQAEQFDESYHPEVNEQQDPSLPITPDEGSEMLTPNANEGEVYTESERKQASKNTAKTSIHKIEAMLLQGEILESADNLIRINPESDNVELWIGAHKNGGLETSLSNINHAIHDFLIASGYEKTAEDAYEVSVNEQQPDYVSSVPDTLGPDSETQPTPDLDDGAATSSQQPPQTDSADPDLGPDSESTSDLQIPSQAPTPHSTTVEMQPGTFVPTNTDLGPDSESNPTPGLEPNEPIITSRHGPTANKLSDDYFLNKKDASQEYIENLYRNRPSRELLQDITNPDKWIARQAANAAIPVERQPVRVAQEPDKRDSIRNAVKGNIMKRRADLYQIGGGVVGEDAFHYTFGYDPDKGMPSQDQMQAFLNDNTLNGEQRYKITAMNRSGYNMANVSITEMTTTELAHRGDLRRAQYDADKPDGMASEYKDVAMSELEEIKPKMAQDDDVLDMEMEAQKVVKIFVESDTGWRGWVKPETAKAKGYKQVEPKKHEHKHKTNMDLLNAGKKGDTSIVHHPEVTQTSHFMTKETPLHFLAGNGKKEVLQHPEVATIRDNDGNTPLDHLASHPSLEKSTILDILKHPGVSISSHGYFNNSPLHHLANNGREEVLSHPDVSKVKNEFGNTPLHSLARESPPSALSHPDVSKVQNNDGNTPLHYLVSLGLKNALVHPDVDKVKNKKGEVPMDMLKYMYPQGSLKQAAPRIKEEWNGDKFSREMEAESAEELQNLHKSLNGQEVNWPQKDAVDPKAEEYYKEYYGEPFGEALTKGDVTKSEPESFKEENNEEELAEEVNQK